MVEISWTPESELWLKDIFDYISQDNPEEARKIINAIYQKAQILSEFPEIGYRYRERMDLNIRVLLYGHYRITYLIKEDNNIDILGIFHGALDIDRYLL